MCPYFGSGSCTPAEQQLWPLWVMASGHAVPSCHPPLASPLRKVGGKGCSGGDKGAGGLEIIVHKSGLLTTLLLAPPGKIIYSVLNNIIV